MFSAVTADPGRAADYGSLEPLFCSPMNRMISLTNMLGVPTIRASIDGRTVAMLGLTKPMRDCFYPDYDYEAARAASGGVPSALPLPVDRRRAATARRRRVRGVDLGNRVDEQVRLAINAPAKFARLARVDSLAKDVLTAYALYGWAPAVSQFPVAAPDLLCGTRIDVVAYGPRLEPVLIENKTGFYGYLRQANGRMRPPLDFADNCPLNQHYLQVLLEKAIVRRYWGLDFGEQCYVVQATTDGVVPYKLPREFADAEEAVWTAFATHLRGLTAKRLEKASGTKRPRPSSPDAEAPEPKRRRTEPRSGQNSV